MKRWRLFGWLFMASITQADLWVITPTQNPISQLSEKQVKDIYLGRQPELPNNVMIKPLDWQTGHKTRMQFYRALFGKSEAQIDAYWARLEFAGHVAPPQQLESESALQALVRQQHNSIVYVTSDTQLPAGFKTVLVIATPP